MTSEFASSRIPLGDIGEPIQPVLNLFGVLGLKIHPRTIYFLRTGRYTGTGTLDLLEYAEVLRNNDASRKDEFYLNLATLGIDNRERQQSLDPHRFTSVGFVKRMRDQTGLRTEIIDRIALAMRVDTSLYHNDTQDPKVLETFRRFYKTYIDHYYYRGRPMRSGYAQSLYQRFGDKGPDSVSDFYQFSYSLMHEKHTAAATLFPYEVDFFEDFYSWQNERNNPLTPFDQQVLRARLEGTDTEFLQEIRQQTAIPLEKSVLYYHRFALAYGTPYSQVRRKCPKTPSPK